MPDTPESPIRGRALDHVVLRVRDLERSLGFYRDVLHLTVEGQEAHRAGKKPFVSVRAGTSLIDLIPDPAATAAAAGMDHLCLEIATDDLSAARRWLEAKGIAVDDGPVRRDGARGWGMSLYVRDPDGYALELKRYDETA